MTYFPAGGLKGPVVNATAFPRRSAAALMIAVEMLTSTEGTNNFEFPVPIFFNTPQGDDLHRGYMLNFHISQNLRRFHLRIPSKMRFSVFEEISPGGFPFKMRFSNLGLFCNLS